MSTQTRSSVRPSSSKQPWGTILKPVFDMGHQRMSEDQIDQTVKRLHTPRPSKATLVVFSSSSSSSSSNSNQRRTKSLSQDEIDAMLERLTKVQKEKIQTATDGSGPPSTGT